MEVITPALDGKIYFNDLEDGKPTRDPIDALYAFKAARVDQGLSAAVRRSAILKGEQVPCVCGY